MRGTSDAQIAVMSSANSEMFSMPINWDTKCDSYSVKDTNCDRKLGQVSDSQGWYHTREKMRTCLMACYPGYADIRPFRCKVSTKSCCIYKFCDEIPTQRVEAVQREEITEPIHPEDVHYNDNKSSYRYGLPTSWENQAVCVLFPEEFNHSQYNEGVTMIESDNSSYSVNTDMNETGACFGDFTGYTEGKKLLMDASNLARGNLDVHFDSYEKFGQFIATIGNLTATHHNCTKVLVHGTHCISNAHWQIIHNGNKSEVGIDHITLHNHDVLKFIVQPNS